MYKSFSSDRRFRLRRSRRSLAARCTSPAVRRRWPLQPWRLAPGLPILYRCYRIRGPLTIIVFFNVFTCLLLFTITRLRPRLKTDLKPWSQLWSTNTWSSLHRGRRNVVNVIAPCALPVLFNSVCCAPPVRKPMTCPRCFRVFFCVYRALR